MATCGTAAGDFIGLKSMPMQKNLSPSCADEEVDFLMVDVVTGSFVYPSFQCQNVFTALTPQYEPMIDLDNEELEFSYLSGLHEYLVEDAPAFSRFDCESDFTDVPLETHHSSAELPGAKSCGVDADTIDLHPERIANGRKQTLTCDSLKVFACTFCSRKFRRYEHLTRHFRSLHLGEKPFECALCNKKFSRRDNLAQHQRRHSKTSDMGVIFVTNERAIRWSDLIKPEYLEA
jgi:hypothetical protein